MNLKSFDGADIFYETFGDSNNTPLVLIHGFGADHRMWLPQIEKYPLEGFYVITPDVRGHGKSTLPAEFDYSAAARDISLILKDLGIKKAHLVGVSMGGHIVQQFACDFPDCTDKLIIADSFSGSTAFIEKFYGSIALWGLKLIPQRQLAKGYEKQYGKLNKLKVGRYFKEQVLKMEKKRLIHIRQQINQFNIFDRITEIKSPTLVLVGDSFGKWFIEMARRTAKTIRGSKFEILPGGADPSNLVAPEIFDKKVLDFL